MTTAEEREEIAEDLWQQVRDQPEEDHDLAAWPIAAFETAREGYPLQAMLELLRCEEHYRMVGYCTGLPVCLQLQQIVRDMIEEQ